jgi:hypothetical protein
MTGLVGINNTMQQQQRNNNRNNTPFVAYQIDCQTTKKGKMFAGTKRRICWKFGFSNSAEDAEKGLSGNECRGEEHEVVFVWSLTSGKKFVLADGHEVHWSKGSNSKNIKSLPFSSSDKFECTWETQMAGSTHELTVIAYASSPLFGKNTNTNNSADGRNNSSNNGTSSSSSFRQFDLLIDGISFSEMPKMFQLGINKNTNMNDVKNYHQAQQRRCSVPSSMSVSTSYINRDRDLFQVSSTTPDRKHSDDDVLVTNTSQPLLLLDCYDQYNPQKQQLHQQGAGITTPRFMSPSQSMPDLLLLDLSSSPTSATHYFPAHLGTQVQTTQAHINRNNKNNNNQISPTSVMNNPFDMYANAANAAATTTTTHQTKVVSAHDNVLRQYNNCFQYTPSSSDRNINYSYAPTTQHQHQQQQHSIVF